MAIDILNIEPTVISRDLKGKYILVYGKPKVGKTTLASKFPKNLLVAFEKGYNAIDGIKAVDIHKWAEFRLVLRQLEKPEAREMYDTITIDTTTIAYEMCEQFICAQHGVQSISDIPWGQGWGLAKKEFEACLRKITMLGYGLVLIAHVDKRIEKNSDDSEIEILAPSMPKRCYEIVNQIVDIMGYISTEWDDQGNSTRWLYTRSTPTVMAGTRFKYLAPKIKLGYDELVEAINKAIDEQKDKDGATVVDKVESKVEEALDYSALMAEAKTLWSQLVPNPEEEKSKEMAKAILKKVEMIFGRPTKISDITEDQVDLLNLVVLELRELNK